MYHPLYGAWTWSPGRALSPTVVQLCPAEARETHGSEHQPAPGSRPILLAQLQPPRKEPLYDLHESALCAGLWAGLTLATETLEPKGLLLSNPRASEGKQSVPPMCHIAARSVPHAPKHRVRSWRAQSRLWGWGLGQCALRMGACGGFILFL